jgi:hypothetical protein
MITTCCFSISYLGDVFGACYSSQVNSVYSAKFEFGPGCRLYWQVFDGFIISSGECRGKFQVGQSPSTNHFVYAHWRLLPIPFDAVMCLKQLRWIPKESIIYYGVLGLGVLRKITKVRVAGWFPSVLLPCHPAWWSFPILMSRLKGY